ATPSLVRPEGLLWPRHAVCSSSPWLRLRPWPTQEIFQGGLWSYSSSPLRPGRPWSVFHCIFSGRNPLSSRKKILSDLHRPRSRHPPEHSARTEKSTTSLARHQPDSCIRTILPIGQVPFLLFWNSLPYFLLSTPPDRVWRYRTYSNRSR